MKLFDLHCDTATEIFKQNKALARNDLHVSLEKASIYEKYVQLTAVYTDAALSDEEGWERFFDVVRSLERECEENGVKIIRSTPELTEFDKSPERIGFILTLEDARILNGKLERVKALYDAGVRVITPLWGGVTVMGGSHDTSEGLSRFGFDAVREMLSIGIITDISHASFKAADEILSLAEECGRSSIATHSDAYAINPHSRNLTDELYLRLVRQGGIVGINLCPKHLSSTPENASIDDVLRHVVHYESLCPSHTALGCDLDGTPIPADIGDVSGLWHIADALYASGAKEEKTNALFYSTAFNYMKHNLPAE